MKQHQPRTALTRIRALLITLGLVLVGVVGVAGPASASIGTNDYPWTDATAVPGGTYEWGYTTCPANDTGCKVVTDSGYGMIDPWGYYLRNCTSFVAWRLSQQQFDPSGMGMAANWGNSAKATNLVNSTPAPGAVAWWSGGKLDQGYTIGSAGHVAYVDSVNSDGSVNIEEYNYGGTGAYHTRTITPGSTQQVKFIHFKDIATGGGYATTFRANDGNLYLYDPVNGAVNTALGVAANTGPAVTPLNDGSFEVAFQAANSGSFYLYNTASGVATNTTLGMATSTSPAVARLGGGGYEAAFQDNTGNLWVYGSAGTHNLGLGMAAGTSPAITGLSDGSYEVAFQANSGSLYLYNSATGATNLALGMASGTNPSIAGLRNGGFEVSFQDNTGNLWVYGNGGTHDLALGMAPGTSPAITGLVDGTYKVAFQASGSGSLYFYDPANGAVNTALGVATGTSPSIYYMSGGGYEAAFQDNQGNLWVYGNAGNADTLLGVSSGTSPAIG